MKRLVLGLLLAASAPTLRAQSPDSEFLEIYMVIQEGENLETDGQFGPATDRFRKAQEDLRQFAKSYPTWNERIVKFRLGFLEEKVGKMGAQPPAGLKPTELSAPAVVAVSVPAAGLAAPERSVAGTPAAVLPGTESISGELADAQTRAESAEARATAAEARREAALHAADQATAKANEATDRASRLALELRQARDRVDVLEASHANLEKARDRLDRERGTLESRLKEALSPKAAAVDPAELAKAEERILLLVKENEVLNAGLEHQMAENRRILDKAKNAIELERQLEVARTELTAQRRQIDDLRGERQKLQARLDTLGKKGAEREANLKSDIDSLKRELSVARSEKGRSASGDTAAELASLREQLAAQKKSTEDLQRDNTSLSREIEKLTAISVTPASLHVPELPSAEMAPADLARLRRLERDQTRLQEELEQARAELQRRDPAAAEARAEQLNRELRRLQGRVAVLESKLEPYTTEELALFRSPQQLILADPATRQPIAAVSDGRSHPEDEPAPGGGEPPAARQLAQANPAPAAPPAPSPAPAATGTTNRPSTGPGSGSGSGEPLPTTPTGSLGKGTNSAASSPASRRRTTKDLPPGAGVLAAQAQRAFAQRQYAVAEKAYREILKMDENNVFTVGNLAAILVEQGRIEDGEAMAKRALVLDPQDPFSLSLLGIIRFRQQRYDEAFDALSQSAQLDPENSETQNYLGITLSQRGQRAAAEAALRKAIKLNPTSPTAHYNLAVVYATQKPPFLELARYHYEKSRKGGQPANPQFEELLRGGAPTSESKTNAAPAKP